jgi:hypothetical protein
LPTCVDETEAMLTAIASNVKRRAVSALAALPTERHTVAHAIEAVAAAVTASGGVVGREWVGFSAMATLEGADGKKQPTKFEALRAFPIYVGAAQRRKILWLITMEAGEGLGDIDQIAAVWDSLDLMIPIAELAGMAAGAAEQARSLRTNRVGTGH